MKLKLYIVTYNRYNDLHTTLDSLFNTDLFVNKVYDNWSKEIYIVNNHSNFSLDSKYHDKVTVLHNTMRPDFSCGHLSRNYNEIFINGFKDLNNPDCDLLMHSHDDNIFHPNFFEQLLLYHEKYNLITFSQGCGFMSYTAEAVKKIGMWDERFCTIGYHEGDYFLRAIKYNHEHTSINDPRQLRTWNPLPHIVYKIPGTDLNSAHTESQKYYSVCRQLFEQKWNGVKDTNYSPNILNILSDPKINLHMMYPYFEKDLYDLPTKYFTNIDTNGRKFM